MKQPTGLRRVGVGLGVLRSALALSCLCATSLHATDLSHLTIATLEEPNSLDPQFSATGPNQAAAMHLYETLFARDASLNLQPALAVDAQRTGALTWRIALRPNVLFHDGSAFDADDVIFSLDRARRVPFSPASFAGRVARIATMRKLDALTVELTTDKPTPQLITDVATVFIVSSGTGRGVATSEFNTGRAAIGTGPWRLLHWKHGDRLALERNPSYWGPEPSFRRATIRYIPSHAARIAALLSGSVDLIDAVPPADLDGLRRRADLTLWQAPTVTFLYIGMDSARDQNPSVITPRGQRERNPLKDVRVRRALSAAIDRELLIEKILSGSGVPANQMTPIETVGFDPEIAPIKHDPDLARALLIEAGWPEGFEITLAAPNNRYLNDALVAQAVAAMLSQVGLKVYVDAMPRNVFLPRASRREFGFYLYGFSSITGESLIGMRSVLGSVDPKIGSGTLNRGGYSNPMLDAALARAARAEGREEFDEYLRQAAGIAAIDVPIIPLYHQIATWASRDGLVLSIRRDDRTLAHSVHPRKVSP